MGNASGSPVVLVTESEYAKALPTLEACTDLDCRPAPSDEGRLANAVEHQQAQAVVVGVAAYRGPLYRALPRGGIIARFGVGHDGIDKAQATRNGLFVFNTPGVLDDAVAEHAVLLMGSLLRRITAVDRAMRTGQWAFESGRELRGKRLLIVGCGSIGCKTARIAALGFGMRVTGVYRSPPPDADRLRSDFGFDALTENLHTALGQADVVSLHVPSTPETHSLFDQTFLAHMNRSAVLVNTARGALVDERALYEALKTGTISGAGLDVFEQEPYVPAAPVADLRTLDNVILTAHIASGTVESCRRVTECCLEGIRRLHAGRWQEVSLLNPEVVK